MTLRLSTFCVLLIFNFPSNQTISACEMYRFEASNVPQALRGHLIKTISSSHVSLCWSECVWLPWCFSMNVRQISEEKCDCELNNSSKRANPNKMATRQGWTYHEMKDVNGTLCKSFFCKRKEDLGDGWYRYGNAAIKLFTDKKNWTAARSHCQSLGGDLLSITSSHENDFIYDIFVQNLNLTYMQEDNGLPYEVLHFKLNGDDTNVTLLGTPGDAAYKQDGREKALYFNGGKGLAQLPKIPITSDKFGFAFWIKVSNHTQEWVWPMNIFNNLYPTIVGVKVAPATNDLYFDVKRADNAVGNFGARRLPLNKWSLLTFSWKMSLKLMKFEHQGTRYKSTRDEITQITLSDQDTWVLGAKSQTYLLSTNNAFHGYLKDVVIVPSGFISTAEGQTILYWYEQGVWIGLNDLSATNNFTWSDGSPVSFKTLPHYSPEPNTSGRRCVGFGKDKIWLDKHCQLKYPYLCEKPAPP